MLAPAAIPWHSTSTSILVFRMTSRKWCGNSCRKSFRNMFLGILMNFAWGDPDRDLTGKMVLPEFRILTPAQWVTEQTDRAEELLWRKTCSQCHAVMYTFVEEHR